ncbi:MAG: calcium/sodium antiporter [Thermodesulfobacteriota bacterium]|nr:calcium/sodium antiporter [Thermodesulfobacteriota bacterium]
MEIFFLLVGGIFFLYAGGESLIRGSTALAFRLGLTPLVVGLTVVAFGTSCPELAVSVSASLDGNAGISLGNVIGSNICNIALILGLSALIRPLQVHVQVIRMQIPIMIAVSLVLALLLMDGILERFEGICFVLGIITYTVYSVYQARKEFNESNKEIGIDTICKQEVKLLFAYLFVLSGFVMLVLGAKLFVWGAVSLASALNISQAVIGLTIVALGTSLPELATSLMAAIKKEEDIAIGNIVGSNIFNILGILGIASLVSPIEIGGISPVDLIVMIVAAILLLPITRTGFLLSRWEGVFLLVFYGAYLYYLIP